VPDQVVVARLTTIELAVRLTTIAAAAVIIIVIVIVSVPSRPAIAATDVGFLVADIAE
jgi:hypothetical protein